MCVFVPVSILCCWIRNVWLVHSVQPCANGFARQTVNQLDLGDELERRSVLDVPVPFEIPPIPQREPGVLVLGKPVCAIDDKSPPAVDMVRRVIYEIWK